MKVKAIAAIVDIKDYSGESIVFVADEKQKVLNQISERFKDWDFIGTGIMTLDDNRIRVFEKDTKIVTVIFIKVKDQEQI